MELMNGMMRPIQYFGVSNQQDEKKLINDYQALVNLRINLSEGVLFPLECRNPNWEQQGFDYCDETFSQLLELDVDSQCFVYVTE
jgi:hypothetical protein